MRVGGCWPVRAAMDGKAARPSYAELAAQVDELREVVRPLQAEHARLRAELTLGQAGELPAVCAGPAVVPSNGWRATTVGQGQCAPPAAERPPRKRRTPMLGRRREQPDQRLVYAPQ